MLNIHKSDSRQGYRGNSLDKILFWIFAAAKRSSSVHVFLDAMGFEFASNIVIILTKLIFLVTATDYFVLLVTTTVATISTLLDLSQSPVSSPCLTLKENPLK